MLIGCFGTNWMISTWTTSDFNKSVPLTTLPNTIHLLKAKLAESIISRNAPVNYPPRSCSLTLIIFFLLGYVVSLIYANKPATLHDLQNNIERVTADQLRFGQI